MARRKSRYIFVREKKEHHFFRNLLIIFLILIVSLVLIDLVYLNQIEYDKLSVTVASLPSDLENWTILTMSDLHGEEKGSQQSMISSTLGNVNVSSAVFAGDMLGKGGDPSALIEVGNLLPATTPKLYLPGDEDPDYLDSDVHGALSPYADWTIRLQDAGFIILDEPILFTRGRNNRARIWFVPEYLYSLDLDSFLIPYKSIYEKLGAKEDRTAQESAQLRVAEYQIRRVERIRESVASMLPSDIQIAVTHVPLTELYVREMLTYTDRDAIFSLRNVSLVIAGHLCAGQVRIPMGKAFYVPGYGSFPEDSDIVGLKNIINLPQYINAGLSVSNTYPIPMRIFNHPGITRITLTSHMR